MAFALRLSLLAILGLTSGCASKWVHKPEINDVRTIAIASVFANRDVGGDRGSKANDAGGSALRKMVGTEDGSDMRVRQVAYADKKFAAMFTKLGWKVVTNEKVAQSASYKKLASVETGNRTLNSIMSFAGRVAQKDYVTLPGAQAIDLADKSGNKAVGKLKDLCEELHVDAVALVQLHMSFDESMFTIVGNRSVRPQARTRLDILTKKGDYAVRTAAIKDSKVFEADESVWINNGKMELNNKAENIFRQAIDKSALDLVKRIQTEIRDKG